MMAIDMMAQKVSQLRVSLHAESNCLKYCSFNHEIEWAQCTPTIHLIQISMHYLLQAV